MTNTTHPVPTIETLCDAADGKPSRDAKTVVVSYGSNGYARLIPSWVCFGDREVPAAEIEMNVRGRKGGLRNDLAAKLRSAGIEIA